MGNTLLTPSIIAKEAIMVLINNMVMAGLVHRNFSNEFAKVGDTITVRKPPTFTSKLWNGSTIDVQDAKEGSVAVKMDTIMDVSFAAGSKEMALSIRDFSEQFIQPAMRAHAQGLDEMLAKLYVDVPFATSVSSTPAIDDIAAIDTIMNNNKVPLDQRSLVLNPLTKNKYAVLPSILNLEKSGSTEALRNASMGKILTFDTFMSQNVQSHVKGTLGTAKVKTGVAAAATAGTFYNTSLTGTLKKGEVFTVAGDATQYVVLALATAAANEVAVTFYPAAAAAWDGDAVVTVVASAAQNLAFHKNAFALVTRPLEKPMGAAYAETLSFNGVSCRIVAGYDMNTKQDTISIDFLCGVKTLTPELAVRFLG